MRQVMFTRSVYVLELEFATTAWIGWVLRRTANNAKHALERFAYTAAFEAMNTFAYDMLGIEQARDMKRLGLGYLEEELLVLWVELGMCSHNGRIHAIEELACVLANNGIIPAVIDDRALYVLEATKVMRTDYPEVINAFAIKDIHHLDPPLEGTLDRLIA